MRVVCFPLGSAGDVFPFLGLAIQLRARGHDVIVATNPHFESEVRREGLAFEPVGTEEDYLRITRDPDLWHPRRGFEAIVRHADRIIRRQHEVCARWMGAGQGVAVANLLSFGVRAARDALGFPLVTVHLQPGVILSREAPPAFGGGSTPVWLRRWLLPLGERWVIDRLAGPKINAWLRELGLPPIRQVARWWNSPDGVLCLFPEWFATPRGDWPRPLIQTNFPLWNSGSEQPLPEPLGRFLAVGPPPVVFAPGTANVQASQFFHASVDACRNLGLRAVLLSRFPGQIPAGLPESCRHIEYAPLDLLLRRSAGIVHHGGVGTTSQALAAGVPQLIRPLAHDQFDNLERVRRLGVGRGISVRQYRARQVAADLKSLLNSPEVKTACDEVRRRFEGPPGLEQAAIAIEQLVAQTRVNRGG
jgi:UDP:flavonoid glycosyltransferase YjiC (YdhE family)